MPVVTRSITTPVIYKNIVMPAPAIPEVGAGVAAKNEAARAAAAALVASFKRK
jgi:hypothetical protein